jgi:hypothetical protein
MAKIMIRNARLAFPQLFEPQTFNGEGKPAYAASFLLTAKDPQVDAVNELIDQVATEKWGVKAKTILAHLRGKDAVCLHNGDLKAQYEGFEGNYFIGARSPNKPLVIGRQREVLTAESGLPYGGCFVNGSVEIYAQDNNFGKRINASLKGVQFVKDGDAFAGGAPASPDEFDDLADQGEGELA